MAGKFKQWLHDKMTDDKGIFQGGSSGKVFGRMRDNNMVSRRADKVRDNSNFRYYDEDPELYDQLGESGVKFKSTPGWFNDRPYTIGNTIYAPRTIDENYEGWNKQEGYNYQNMSEYLAYEESPHVAQFRNEGILGMLSDYQPQSHLHGQLGMYDIGNSLEGFHQNNDPQKRNLISQVFEADPNVNFTGHANSSYSSRFDNPFDLENYDENYYHEGQYDSTNYEEGPIQGPINE